jgi:hypothetical protein
MIRETNGMRAKIPMRGRGGEGDPGMGQGMIVTPPAKPPARVVNPAPAPIKQATAPVSTAARAKAGVTRSNNQFERAWNATK